MVLTQISSPLFLSTSQQFPPPLLSIFSESNLSGSVSCWTALRFADPVHVVSTLIIIANNSSKCYQLKITPFDDRYI